MLRYLILYHFIWVLALYAPGEQTLGAKYPLIFALPEQVASAREPQIKASIGGDDVSVVEFACVAHRKGVGELRARAALPAEIAGSAEIRGSFLDAAHGPLRVFGDEWLGVLSGALQCGEVVAGADVAEGDADVAQEAAGLDGLDGRAGEEGAKCGIVQREEIAERCVHEVAGGETGFA